MRRPSRKRWHHHGWALDQSKSASRPALKIGVRYVQAAITLPSTSDDDVDTAMRRIRTLACAMRDSTTITTDRVADSRRVILNSRAALV
ncbi:hypothetical protein [Micromonospora sp. NPDC005174]|uniref:hypothetical protein n=1 Tax=unclassified Micromonospora TaxID=2617518 RepID=UPI0033A658EB